MSKATLADMTAVAALLTAVAACMALVITGLIGRRSKISDVLMHCHPRFDVLTVDREQIEKRLASAPAGDPTIVGDIDIWSGRF